MADKEEYYREGECHFLSRKVKRYRCEDCNQYWEISDAEGREVTQSNITSEYELFQDEVLQDELLDDEDSEMISCPMCGSPYVIEI